MLRDDWVMRMVRQLAAALARIAGLRRAGLLDEAAEKLDEAFTQLGVDPKLAGSADAGLLLGLTPDPARREALRQLLEERDAIAAARAGRQPS